MIGSNYNNFQPLISIIMNCYNGEKYLNEALNTVLNQSYTNWEIIFWDNQSVDDSCQIFKSYNDKRFKYFLSNEHTTLGKARNLAVEKASGDWLAFLDSDDEWLFDKLEKQVSSIKNHSNNLGLVYGNVNNLIENGVSYKIFTPQKFPEGYIFNELLLENFISLLSALVKKEAYIKVGGVDASFKQSEDYDLFVKVSRLYNAAFVESVIAKYRLHPGNISLVQKDLAFIEAIKIVSRYLPNKFAKKGLKYWSSLYLLSSIKRKKINKTSITSFLKYGSIWNLLKIVIRYYA
jgi:glycosyltransferase involved in cell wall biosynthesis